MSSNPDGRRRGGREARKALRAAPLAEDIKPIRSGLEGGQYRPLSDNGVQRIHQAALELLETVGFARATPSAREILTNAGALWDSNHERIMFPRTLVEETIAKAGRRFSLYGQDSRHDLHPHGTKVHFGTGGAAVHVVDLATREYRESTLLDLYQAARLVDTLDNIHYFQRPMVARDMLDPLDLDLNTTYACISGTTKHVGVSFTNGHTCSTTLEMLQLVAGSEAKWRARPFVSNSNCFVVPPMKFAEDACDVLEAAVRGGMPVLLLSAGQAGATAPAAIAGAVTQAVAEVLAGLVYVNAINPGHPAIFGTWPFVSDLRTGAMSGGSAEQALLTAACAQMAHYYDLPGGSAAGMADAKLPDIQSGYEKGITEALAGLAGINLCYESAGMHASLLGFCLESLVIDNDILGATLRCVRGIEVNDDTLSLETVRQVCLEGPGHYLGHEQTLALMQSEYVYPGMGDRSSPKEWNELGKPDIIAKACAWKDQVLAQHYPSHISATVDALIRNTYRIHLPSNAMHSSTSK